MISDSQNNTNTGGCFMRRHTGYLILLLDLLREKGLASCKHLRLRRVVRQEFGDLLARAPFGTAVRVEATWTTSLAPHLARTCALPSVTWRCGCYAGEVEYWLTIWLFRVRARAFGFNVIIAVLVGVRWALLGDVDHLVALATGLIVFFIVEAKELPAGRTFEELIGLDGK